MTLGNDNGTDGQTDRQTDRQSATQYAAPPREEGRISFLGMFNTKKLLKLPFIFNRVVRKIKKVGRFEIHTLSELHWMCVSSIHIVTSLHFNRVRMRYAYGFYRAPPTDTAVGLPPPDPLNRTSAAPEFTAGSRP